MIAVTKLNGQNVIINAELIKMVEQTPDTLVTLTTGDHMMIRESVEEVVERAIEYARRIRGFQVV